MRNIKMFCKKDVFMSLDLKPLSCLGFYSFHKQIPNKNDNIFRSKACLPFLA